MRVVLLDTININNKHISKKHISFMFYIDEYTRALLHEVSRSRGISPTVKSSRYTLNKDLKQESSFITNTYKGNKLVLTTYNSKTASKYIRLTDDKTVNNALIRQLEELRLLTLTNKSNDVIKYAIPECYYTKGVYTIPYDDLLHLCRLRLHRSALLEYRLLMKEIIKSLPESINDEFIKLDIELTKDLV
jgi:thymidylate synthase ThyX